MIWASCEQFRRVVLAKILLEKMIYIRYTRADDRHSAMSRISALSSLDSELSRISSFISRLKSLAV